MRLGMVAIAKDEAANIERCLESAIRAGVTVATIVDTGSTDQTRAMVRRACQGIELRLYRRKFRGFGPTRSEAFRLARGTADWLLALDADMAVQWDAGFVPDPSVECYTIEMGNTRDFSWRLPLLLRGDLPWESRGVVHAYTTLPDRLYRSAPTDAVRIARFDSSSPAKTRRQAELLQAEYDRDPSPRTTFYLAQTRRELGENDVARDLYYQRSRMGGYAEEVYYAFYRGALLERQWPDQLAALLRAWEYRPSRLEALHAAIAGLNRRGLHHAAWPLASVSIAPCADTLFVHRWVWHYGMLLERQIAASAIGAPELLRITDRLLSLELPPNVRQAVTRNAGLRAA